MERIKKSTFTFLSDLKMHNEKGWFNENRSSYDNARSNYSLLIDDIIRQITVFDPIMKGLEAKSCMFRINRDIRFSSDKSVYKTHFGAYIVQGGKNNADRFAGYYIHLEPGNNSMIAGGAWVPPAPWLSAIRENISESGDDLMQIISSKEFTAYFGTLDGESLKTAPRGYPKDHKYIDLLRLKSLVGVKMFRDEEVLKESWTSEIVNCARALQPLVTFLNNY